MATYLTMQSRIDMSNTNVFNREFKRNVCDTLPFIFEARKYIRTNNFTDVGVQFARIYNGLDTDIQEALMLQCDAEDEDMNDNPELNVQMIYDYLLATYPPPIQT